MAIDWHFPAPGDRAEKKKKRRPRKKRPANLEQEPKLLLSPVLLPTPEKQKDKYHEKGQGRESPDDGRVQPPVGGNLESGTPETGKPETGKPETGKLKLVKHTDARTALPVPQLSPRKQAILRHKKSDASVEEPQFVSEVKQLKKNRKPMQPLVSGAEDEKFSRLLAGQSMADKATIFRAPSARISVYHEQVVDLAPAASGTLLGHGEFTIFQLHNGDITYLACGSSFVYPLLPKLKILRVNRTHFILPLVNPQRYWKIDVDTHDDATLAQLEQVLQDIVNYTTLYVELDNSPAGHVDLLSSDPVSAIPDDAAGNYTPFFNAIPESPPSAPVSPQQLNLYDTQLTFARMMSPPQLDLNKPDQKLLKTHSQPLPQSLPQILPTLSSLSQGLQPDHVNPYKFVSNGSDSSSMDSLLDEYEENVSMTKSINFNASQPPSHSASLVSVPHPPNITYSRGRAFVLPDRSVAGSSYGGRRNDELDDGFPTTSLSQYNRRRTSQGGRSRQSSVSELYTSVSNWMEPGAAPQLTHSRSNYTLGSRASGTRPVNVKDTYRDIYRSITLHDIAGLAATPEKRDVHCSKLLVTDQFSRKPSSLRPVRKPEPNPSQSRLSSSEVFQLLSQREEKVERPSGIGRFFGW